jgi:CheY-like chemotaxis protein
MCKVLYIDDDTEDCEVFEEALHALYPRALLTFAGNGKEGIEVLVQSNNTPDVIFLDINMPVMNGKEFLIALKNNDHYNSIPIVVYSTTANHKHAQEYLKLGAKMCLQKASNYTTLTSVIRESIGLICERDHP